MFIFSVVCVACSKLDGICVVLQKELRIVLIQLSIGFCPLQVSLLKMTIGFVLTCHPHLWGKNVTSLKNGKVMELYVKILYALLPCDNYINAVFHWCVPRGGFCPQEKETVHILSFCPFPQSNTQRQMRDKGLSTAVFLHVIYPGKNTPSVKCLCRSLETFSEDLKLLFLHSCSCFPPPHSQTSLSEVTWLVAYKPRLMWLVSLFYIQQESLIEVIHPITFLNIYQNCGSFGHLP